MFKQINLFLIILTITSVSVFSTPVVHELGFMVDAYATGIPGANGLIFGRGNFGNNLIVGDWGQDFNTCNNRDGKLVKIINQTPVNFSLNFVNPNTLTWGSGRNGFSENLYVSDTNCDPAPGFLYVVDAQGNKTLFVDFSVDGFAAEIAGFDFPPAWSNFDHKIYAAEVDGIRTGIIKIDSSGNITSWINYNQIGGPNPVDVTFSPGGVWGDYLFTAEANSNKIYKIDSNGNVQFFSQTTPRLTDIVFSPGGSSPFGNYLYAITTEGKIYKIDTNGNIQLFAENINVGQNLSWPPFAGKMCFSPNGYELYVAADGDDTIWRIYQYTPTPTITPTPTFSPTPPPLSLDNNFSLTIILLLFSLIFIIIILKKQ